MLNRSQNIFQLHFSCDNFSFFIMIIPIILKIILGIFFIFHDENMKTH